jgi:DNA-binding transcriptional LysR family regulator
MRGYGIAALSHFVVAADLRAGRLAVLPVAGWNVSSMISLLRIRDALLDPGGKSASGLGEKTLCPCPIKGLRFP